MAVTTAPFFNAAFHRISTASFSSSFRSKYMFLLFFRPAYLRKDPPQADSLRRILFQDILCLNDRNAAKSGGCAPFAGV